MLKTIPYCMALVVHIKNIKCIPYCMALVVHINKRPRGLDALLGHLLVKRIPVPVIY